MSLDAHFRAHDNVLYEQHVLSLSGESADKFLVHLKKKKKQARHCNFGKALDDKLRDQLKEKLSNIEWEKRLLEVRNILLEDAMDKIWVWDQAHDQVAKMTRTYESTNAVGAKKAYGKTCFSCGKEGPSLVIENVLYREYFKGVTSLLHYSERRKQAINDVHNGVSSAKELTRLFGSHQVGTSRSES